MNRKKTKIICTISGDNCSIPFLTELYNAGMNVVRINSAHITPDKSLNIINNTRAVSDKIAILVDTKGPEIRLTQSEPTEGFKVEKGDILEFMGDPNGTTTRAAVFTNYKDFVKDVPVGANILIDDGETSLTVIEKTDYKVTCRAENSGIIKGRKSVNVPGVSMSNLPPISEKDKEFIQFSIDNGVDFIAHSFVRNKEDLKAIHALLSAKQSHIKIISKIENQEGVNNIDEILNHCYGVMVARGDLGVEIVPEKMPAIQEYLVNKCRERKKPVIIATQMLHSMIEHPRPTRAEVTDVAYAILQRTDAIMLSGETANGKYPIEAVKTMCRIALEVEKDISVSDGINLKKVTKPIAAVLARSLVSATQMLPIKAIIFDTLSGRTGRYLSEFRPKVPLFALCYNDYTARELAMSFNVTADIIPLINSRDAFIKFACEYLLRNNYAKDGDLVGIIGGSFRDEDGASYMEIIECKYR